MKVNNIVSMNVKELFSSAKYIIPIYQRNYAWGEAEITQLIQDIADFAKDEPELNYHIGTLVVYKRNTGNSFIYETIDGQQRLTTLNILLSMIKREYSSNNSLDTNWFSLNLEFASRQHSTDALHLLAQEGSIMNVDHNEYKPEIMQGYKDSQKALKRILNENNLSIEMFYNYLTEKVFILRVPVPHDTDLNHYFEIMNSRGEQLEKHEILKAKFIEILKDDKDACYAFNKIWEACADMERYVQYGFSVAERDALFTAGDWNTFTFSDFDGISAKLKQGFIEKNNTDELTILEIIKLKPIISNDPVILEEGSERFNSVINFSNFLLHVLRIQTAKNISLDDKRLLELFTPYFTGDKILFTKLFGYNLLKCKFLFDRYIIKREFIKDSEQWSLKKINRSDKKVWYVNTFGNEVDEENENKEILMLLSMFHVSSPTLVYKHWLNGALRFVFHNPDCSTNDYKTYLEKLACSFLVDRYLSDKQSDYYDIIYKNDAVPQRIIFDESLFHKGTSVENFIFNYLDWLLWKSKNGTMEFTFRSSVEHYYPQNPKGDNNRISDDYLHHFGNLCLISSSKNSALSNYMPAAKMDHYAKVKPDSIKQQLMMKITIDKSTWGIDEICSHGNEMIRLLKEEVSRVEALNDSK